MSSTPLYPITIGTQVCARILGLDPSLVMEEAGLSTQHPGALRQQATAEQFFSVWHALERLYSGSDIVEKLGLAIARGSTLTAFFALTFAPNALIGLRRMARYSQLLGPVHLHVSSPGSILRLEISCSDPGAEIPATLAAVYCVGYVEKIRTMTAKPISPVSVTLNPQVSDRSKLEGVLMCPVAQSGVTTLTFNKADMECAFISENSELWSEIEADLSRQLARRENALPMSERVKVAILDLLPKGNISGDAVADIMGVSRSTLQRRLADESLSFHQILEATRRELAMRYVGKSALTNSEISYLLAYKDPNSFYRGFKRWTGLTPKDYRASIMLMSEFPVAAQ